MKLRSILSLALVALAVAVPASAKAADQSAVSHLAVLKTVSPAVQAQPYVHATPDAPSHVPLAPLTMLGFGLMGATGAAKGSRKLTLGRAYLHNNQTYGPGRNIEVPEDFPELRDDGSVIYEAGSVADRNQARSRQAPPPAGTPIENPAGTVSGKTLDELSRMNKAELTELAEEQGIEVSREDGGDGEPLVSDYITALSAPEDESTE